MSLENPVIIYVAVLCAVLTYVSGSVPWGISLFIPVKVPLVFVNLILSPSRNPSSTKSIKPPL